ncbi:hypothetical protein DPMN_101494 [Dreissena polymorpha]|uniref:Uncharacterized protein n=1 Tax=Dreissena polymorpha TaxID=45954 RepID=A0A9D4R957_DREPO|nr:hypothetical protein DPMN_101494 [Dreissena polymorpha]
MTRNPVQPMAKETGECWNRILKAFANSLDPDETPQNMAEPSLSEKKAYADSLVKLEEAEKYLGQTYCVLVLGLGLQDEHHMQCGV